MKKLIILLVLCFAMNGCDKDECGCYYSQELGQYVQHKFVADDHISGEFVLSEEQLKAIQAECRVRENCN